ncbi:synaptic vesicle 2-related protein-like [Uloborus diversus]|uniref:synaptic vesicle 2-related protein-like n=1 Tax=Uloborus diversus TaxID=327109 RepID=UPI0024094E41|nr:synaptic vesicle 2-related protein-like [Uloborus diversus]
MADEKGEMTKVYTIDDAVRKVGFGKFQHFVLFLAGMGWSLLASMIMLFVFGAVSAASPSYTWMVIFRGMTGFAMGGIGQGLTLSAEYMPPKSRAFGGYYLAFYWSVGTVAIALANWAVMATLNDWRVLLLVTAIPAFIVLLSLKWYPESVRFYLISDQYDKAVATLEKMAKMNNKELPEGRLIHVDTVESRGRVTDLFRPQLRVTTSLFCVMWFSICFSYYGVSFVSPSLIKIGNVYEGNLNILFTLFTHSRVPRTCHYLWLSTPKVVAKLNTSQTDVVPCEILTTDKFVDMLWTSASELPGLVVFTILVNKMRNKTLVMYACIISGSFIFLILIDTNLRWLINLFQFVARAIVISVFQLVYIMTSEAFPTPVRAVAIGLGTAFARLGGLTVPFVSQVCFVLT